MKNRLRKGEKYWDLRPGEEGDYFIVISEEPLTIQWFLLDNGSYKTRNPCNPCIATQLDLDVLADPLSVRLDEVDLRKQILEHYK